MLMWVTLPFFVLHALYYVLFCMKKQRNVLTAFRETGGQLTGLKRGMISDDFEVKPLKELAKHHKATFNDVIMALLCTTMYKYFESKGKVETEITLGLPVSFRKVAKTADALDLSNDLSPFFYDLQLTDDFEAAIQKIKT